MKPLKVAGTYALIIDTSALCLWWGALLQDQMLQLITVLYIQAKTCCREQVNGNRCQVRGSAEGSGGCGRLIPSLQLPPILNHTIRICQWATRLVFTHSGDRQGQMASRDAGQSRHSGPLRTRSPHTKGNAVIFHGRLRFCPFIPVHPVKLSARRRQHAYEKNQKCFPEEKK